MQFNRLATSGVTTVAALFLTSTALNAAPQTDAPPVCINGGPYVFECTGPDTPCTLDGSASFDPDGTPVTFLWFEECPFGFFDDPTSPTPVYHIDMTGVCSRVCVVEMRAISGGQTTKCNTTVTVNDTLPPVIVCPPDVVEVWTNGPAGGQTNPALTGFATASDCDPNPTIGFSDVLDPGNAPGEPETIVTRTWTALDQCGLQSSCIQTITLLSPGLADQTYYLDAIKGSCPNALSASDTSGLFSCVLFGRNGHAVADINTSTLVLARLDNGGGTVDRMSIQVKDVGRPKQTDPCDCDGNSKDNYMDFVINSSKASVITSLDLAQEVGSSVQVVLYGQKNNGAWFTAYDCIQIDP
jgi:hypothetical protein